MVRQSQHLEEMYFWSDWSELTSHSYAMASSTCANIEKGSSENFDLIDHRERVVRMRFLPSLSRQLVKEGENVLTILGKVLGSVVKQGEDVVGGVLRVHTALLKEVAVPLFSLRKVLLGS